MVSENSTSRVCLYENLHSATETEDEMERQLLLDVIIRKGAVIIQLLACEDKSLLIRREAGSNNKHRIFKKEKIINLLNFRLDENLHSSTETKDEVEGRLFLNVIIRKRSAILERLSGENQTLLVRRDAAMRI